MPEEFVSDVYHGKYDFRVCNFVIQDAITDLFKVKRFHQLEKMYGTANEIDEIIFQLHGIMQACKRLGISENKYKLEDFERDIISNSKEDA